MSEVQLSYVNPPQLGAPRGFNHGVLGQGRLLFVAGQIGAGADGRVASGDFVAQFAQALDNVLAVLHAAGGRSESLARLTMYVLDKHEYAQHTSGLRAVWRERLGGHYPAMTLVEVQSLLDDAARLELEATAVL